MPNARMALLTNQVRQAGANGSSSTLAEYGGDPTRMTVSGHSAGAHLASFLFLKDTNPSGLAAALLLSGLYELEPLRSSFPATRNSTH